MSELEPELEPGVPVGDRFTGECEARSFGGWHCCLPMNHDGNHIGTTQDFGRLHQWNWDDDE